MQIAVSALCPLIEAASYLLKNIVRGNHGSPKLLQRKRVAAILIDHIVVKKFEIELADATVTPIADLTGYMWIRNELKHRAEEIAQAIRAYRAKGRSFDDPLLGNN